MDHVSIKDKVFEPYISPEQIQARIQQLAQTINKLYANKNPILVIVLNGAFIFAADLIRGMTVQPQTQFIRVSSYEDRMQSSQKVKQILGLNMPLVDRHVLIIEDIVDTGHTAKYLRSHIHEQQPASLAIVTLLYKPDAFLGGVLPEHVGFKISNDFVVGYGLDYAQLGRELSGIYKLME